jgi:hypothetical protein
MSHVVSIDVIDKVEGEIVVKVSKSVVDGDIKAALVELTKDKDFQTAIRKVREDSQKREVIEGESEEK